MAAIGGASNVLQFADTTTTVGERNARFALSFLALEGIPVRAERLRGERPLEVRFETDSGRVLLRTLPVTAYRQAAVHEARLRRELEARRPQNDVTLFLPSR